MELALRRLRYVGDVVHPISSKFKYSRDPKDEKLIELAIVGRATHLVTADKYLLALASGRGEAADRFRQRAPFAEVTDVVSFLDQLDAYRGI